MSQSPIDTHKSVAIMQPYLFPYLGYFQVMNAVDEYVIYDDVNFIKGGWINRNNILMQGNKQLISIALSGASPNKLINEVGIGDNFVKFQKTIDLAYAKAPYRADVVALIARICSFGDHNLAHFTANSLREIATYLGITTKLTLSSGLKKDTTLRAQDKVIAICQELGAGTYINSIGGQELYSQADFAAAGINLKFLNMNHIEYPQFGGEFIAGLSIIDVMMFNSPQRASELLEEYELV